MDTEKTSPPIILRLADFGRQHPGLFLTLGYLSATAVGMLSSWTFYRRFGVNIFHYAQLSDFVLVPLRHPLAAVAILAAFPAVWLIMKTDELLDRRLRWYKYVYGPEKLRRLSCTPAAWTFYLILYAYAFSLVHSNRLAAPIASGLTGSVEAQLQTGDYLGGDGTRPFLSSLLGTTTAYVFLYDVPSGAVTVVPLENLARVTLR